MIGGGTRVKILEALAMERPVVSTSIGAEGLELAHGSLGAASPTTRRRLPHGVVDVLQDAGAGGAARRRGSPARRGAFRLGPDRRPRSTSCWRRESDWRAAPGAARGLRAVPRAPIGSSHENSRPTVAIIDERRRVRSTSAPVPPAIACAELRASRGAVADRQARRDGRRPAGDHCLEPLKRQHPRSHITWITRAEAVPLLAGNPHDRPRPRRRDRTTSNSCTAEEFDLALGPDADLLSARRS